MKYLSSPNEFKLLPGGRKNGKEHVMKMIMTKDGTPFFDTEIDCSPVSGISIDKENICKRAHGITMAEAHAQRICVECREKVHLVCSPSAIKPGSIYSEDGELEYGISGLCEYCFDNICSYDDDDDDEEE